jgi:PAS domain S-box-containing protein
MKSATEKSLTIIFSMALMLLIANAIFSYRALLILIRNRELVSHSRAVLLELEVVLSTIKDAETGQRGFIITGKENYLTPYQIAISNINDEMNRLKALGLDDPIQQRQLTRLESEIAAKFSELNMTMALRKQNGFEAARSQILNGDGKQNMDNIRQTIAEMAGKENEVLKRREAESEASKRTAIITFSISSLTAVTGLILVFFLAMRRLAERKRNEEEIENQRELLQVTLASIGDGVIATDTHGYVTFINPVTESLTGWSQLEARGKPLTEVFKIVNAQTHQPIENPVTRVLKEGMIVNLANQAKLIAKNGAEIAIDDSAAPITSKGKLIGVVLIFRDVTERKLAEEERARLLASAQAARAEAETANRAKDHFLAMVSHELRTPLTAILGWARLLRIGKLDIAGTAQAIEIIERNAKTQSRLIDDLLDISRIISGKLRLNCEPVNLASTIEATLETARPAAKAKSIQLRTEIDARSREVTGDVTRLQQIIWNLLSNAIKFTPSGGRVEVKLNYTELEAHIIISDTGRGINPQFLPKIFERFQQADSKETRQHGGLGLGLAITRNLVELHGGTISAESPGEGHGTTFMVTLPLKMPQTGINKIKATQAEMIYDELPSLDGVKVLVVDDEASARDLITAILTQCGASVTAVASATEAIKAIEQTRPDVMVSDIGMPGESGYELIEKVRKLKPEQGGKIPAVALTAYAKKEDRMHALMAGFQMHIAKPVEPIELAIVIASLVEENRNRKKAAHKNS